jgi:hypothetical protein
MVPLLHPSMTLFTIHSHFAACSFNGLDLIGKIPIIAFDRFILILFGISPVVLNVMGVGTFVSFVTKLWREKYF